VTTLSPIYKFPCPDDEDMANLGLYMEDLALKLDAEMQARRSGLLEALNRPTALWSLAADVTSNSSALIFSNLNYNLLFSNYPMAIAGQKPLPPVGRPGWYHFGFYGRVEQVATVVAAQSRNFAVRVSTYNGGIAPGTIADFNSQFYLAATVESNTAGATGSENFIVRGMVELPSFPASTFHSGGALAIVETWYKATLGGGGGNVSLKAGSILWLTFLGEGDQVEVVS